jgi:phospholipid/cholesterol/gamma-HCH transport system permease protein
MNVVGLLGENVIARWRSSSYLAGLIAAVLAHALRPSYWRRTVRGVLARQILFTGVEAVRFVALVAFLVGISVVLQAQVWLSKVGQSAMIGPLLVAAVVRELGPLLTNFVVIGRSGTAIASELANMKVNGEIRVLDAQGLDPFIYLAIPRILGVMLSVFCLSIVFIVVSFASGYVGGMLLGTAQAERGLFLNAVFGALAPADVFNLVAKTTVPGLLTGAICCSEGLGIQGLTTDVPQAAGRAVVKSVAALFVTSAIVSLMTYL